MVKIRRSKKTDPNPTLKKLAKKQVFFPVAAILAAKS